MHVVHTCRRAEAWAGQGQAPAGNRGQRQVARCNEFVTASSGRIVIVVVIVIVIVIVRVIVIVIEIVISDTASSREHRASLTSTRVPFISVTRAVYALDQACDEEQGVSDQGDLHLSTLERLVGSFVWEAGMLVGRGVGWLEVVCGCGDVIG